MFNLMFAIFALILSSPPAQAEQLELLCKEGINPSGRTLTALYEKTSVTTPAGPKTVYVASQLFFVRSFVPATVVAGIKAKTWQSENADLRQRFSKAFPQVRCR